MKTFRIGTIAKRFRLGILFMIPMVLIVGGTVGAQEDILEGACRDRPNPTLCNQTDRQQDIEGTNAFFGPDGIITNGARLLSVVAGIAAVFFIVIGGFRFITASGDASQIESARNMVLYALIGLVVAAAAQAIVLFVLNRIGL